MKLSFSSNFLYEFKGLGNLSRQRSIDRQTTFKTGRKQIFGNWNIFCLGPLKLLNTDYRGLLPLEKKIDPSTYNYTREDTMAYPSSLRPPFFTLFSKIVRLTLDGKTKVDVTAMSTRSHVNTLCLHFKLSRLNFLSSNYHYLYEASREFRTGA